MWPTGRTDGGFVAGRTIIFFVFRLGVENIPLALTHSI